MASHYGGLSLAQLTDFLDRGARAVGGGPVSPADSAFAEGERFLGSGQRAQADSAYRRALALGGPAWPRREDAVAQLTWTLLTEQEAQACAEMAVAEAPGMKRGVSFVRVVLAGFSSACRRDSTAWSAAARARLAPLAAEASQLPVTARNDRFVLYQTLMMAADMDGDTATVRSWGERWLAEIERTVPQNDDERTALDVARRDVVAIMGAPERVIPALEASERAMPHNYNASLRLAEVYDDAKRYDDAVAACDRGLRRGGGPLARTWLLEVKADAQMGRGESAQARATLEQARVAANAIVMPSNRDSNLKRISSMMAYVEKHSR